MADTTTAAAAAAASPGLAEQLDAALQQFLSTHNASTYILLTLTLAVLLYPLLTARDPDIHPFLLARQSTPSPVRHPKQSAVYRALDVPHGFPLRSSLGVKDPGMPKWSSGRQGDVRDVLRRAVRGPVREDGGGGARVGKCLTVMGTEVRERGWDEVMGAVNAIGAELKRKGSEKVAVCLCNGVELLAAVFAGAFYDFHPVLLPSGLPPDRLNDLLARSDADTLVAEAGAVDLHAALSNCKAVTHVVLVANQHNQHMNWDETPVPSGVSLATWHGIVEEGGGKAPRDVPEVEKGSKIGPLSTFGSRGDGEYELVEFTPENIVSGIAGLGATLVRENKITSSDIFLPTSSLTEPYALCWTLAAMYANATIALNSVAGENVDLSGATAGIEPTIIVASSGTVSKYLHETTNAGSGPGLVGRYFQQSSLQKGIMPPKGPAVKLSSLSKLRLLFIGQPAFQGTRLASSALHELRIILGARVVSAGTAPRIAGGISQTHVSDYRDKGDLICVGPPVGSVEIHMTGEDEHMDSAHPRGKLFVKGPSVSGGLVELDVRAEVDEDNTLILL